MHGRHQSAHGRCAGSRAANAVQWGVCFYSFFRKWSKYPDSAPKRQASEPCIKMDSSESWHFAQLSTQAFGNMAPSAGHCPPFRASGQFWKRNSAHNQGILTTTPKTHEVISDIRKNLFIARGETLIFIHLRENEGRRATMMPRSDTRKVGRNALQRPRQPTSLNGRVHRVPRAYRAPRAHRAPNQGIKKPHCWGSLNQWCGRKDLNLHGVAPIWT